MATSSAANEQSDHHHDDSDKTINLSRIHMYNANKKKYSTQLLNRTAASEAKEDNSLVEDNHDTDTNDVDCPFRTSPLYRKIYVYPNPYEIKEHPQLYNSSILSSKRLDQPWPWLEFQKQCQRDGLLHYDPKHNARGGMWSTELLFHELLTNPKSCLRTTRPEDALLFYVPYLSSVEHHLQKVGKQPHWYPRDGQSPYGTAIYKIFQDGNYNDWEYYWGLTSRWWKRRNGTDHILVHGEPLDGLIHSQHKRGNYYYKHTQLQLESPIAISVEVSKTFLQQYPKSCTSKNILLPYPNTDGDWFNGKYDQEVEQILLQHQQLEQQQETTTIKNGTTAMHMILESSSNSAAAALLEEKIGYKRDGDLQARPASMFYEAGNHGTCTLLRKSLQSDYKCSNSWKLFHSQKKRGGTSKFMHGMRISTFCPCPGGDSPSAKRMFDCFFAGSIPVILSEDFIWPFTKESMDSSPSNQYDDDLLLDPLDFSIRLNATDYWDAKLDKETCQLISGSKSSPSLEGYLSTIPAQEIRRLRRGVAKARELFSWYKYRKDLPSNPLQEGILPDGGLVTALVKALEERATSMAITSTTTTTGGGGETKKKYYDYSVCEKEMQNLPKNFKDATRFVC